MRWLRWIGASALALAALAGGTAHAATVIYLNRCSGNCTYTPGPNDSITDTSSILSQTSSLAEFALGDTSWDAVVACVRDTFAPFDVVVVDVDPGTIPHLEIAVAGSPGQVGLPASVPNVAPITCEGDRVVSNGIAFAFANAIGDAPLQICWNAAQAAGALVGLDRELLAGDVMADAGAFPRVFRDELASCGEASTARTCQCGGTTQNSYQWLRATLPEPGALAAGGGALLALAALRRGGRRR